MFWMEASGCPRCALDVLWVSSGWQEDRLEEGVFGRTLNHSLWFLPHVSPCFSPRDHYFHPVLPCTIIAMQKCHALIMPCSIAMLYCSTAALLTCFHFKVCDLFSKSMSPWVLRISDSWILRFLDSYRFCNLNQKPKDSQKTHSSYYNAFITDL